ncbi:Rpn family recombination-promoting nuclease/putative transposase [Gracilibacillus sp. S3-1-1]|uniref:Rpn family recombination-promoting nuclease/putative transposase n=1 Tax=Gracilibacillus pellucidus TaxID=3095368 RepID=A0ACC6M8A6_9BACI|nr:Rpn family recombination-promoting nuclease/putative transposase [Gracilibacillus sp. S3-1-1]MDX8047218.1 Rpn family recombination-promoting nuclease/putative transposase [Gracilibacillus sp. S3-1-1]
MKIHNPHDKYFKAIFSNVEVVKDFLTHFVPPSISMVMDLETLEPQKDSFINDSLRENFSDMLFQVKIQNKNAYLSLLFEHKSTINKMIPVQLLEYMLSIWRYKQEKAKAASLPIIFPIVIYHGQQDWTASSLGEVLEGYHLMPAQIQKYVPNYEYFLFDVSKYNEEEIKWNVQLHILFLLFRDIYQKDITEFLHTVYSAIHYLKKLDDQETAIQYLETSLRYIINANHQLTKAAYHDIIK